MIRSRRSCRETKDEDIISQKVGDYADYSFVSDYEYDEVYSYYSEYEYSDDDEPDIDIIFDMKENKDTGRLEYLVKFKNESYRKVRWFGDFSRLKNIRKCNKFKEKYKDMNIDRVNYFNPDFLKPDVILSSNNDKYLVKWKNLPITESTFEDINEINDENVIKEYNTYYSMIDPKQIIRERVTLKGPITSKNNDTLHDYQIDGVNFFIENWCNKRSVILADEMGLGKTAQTCCFLNHLNERENIDGPFLIVVVASVLDNWEREIEKWTNLKVLKFIGKIEEKRMILDYLVNHHDNDPNHLRFQIFLTTYETLLSLCDRINHLRWAVIVLDEAHKIRNRESKTRLIFDSFNAEFKILLTGTPIQNNLSEFWTLANFLDPHKFSDPNFFVTENIQQIKDVAKTFMLRREKKDVNIIIPLVQNVVYCSMTKYQKLYYQILLSESNEFLSVGVLRKRLASIGGNIAMELRKVCNHPYILKGDDHEDRIIDEIMSSKGIKERTADLEMDTLIKTSGKMILLDKILQLLYQKNHKVLIFSQFKKMLDIIERYFLYKNYGFCRLDGDTAIETRQKSISEFNTNKDMFGFLLCTKAGGIGINLSSADVVIVFDPDWNPHNDNQAIARCHRLGQEKVVKVFRFITPDSYENNLFLRSSLKLGIDKAFSSDQFFEIESYLKKGAFDVGQSESNEVNESFLNSVLQKQRISGQPEHEVIPVKFHIQDDIDRFAIDIVSQQNQDFSNEIIHLQDLIENFFDPRRVDEVLLNNILERLSTFGMNFDDFKLPPNINHELVMMLASSIINLLLEFQEKGTFLPILAKYLFSNGITYRNAYVVRSIEKEKSFTKFLHSNPFDIMLKIVIASTYSQMKKEYQATKKIELYNPEPSRVDGWTATHDDLLCRKIFDSGYGEIHPDDISFRNTTEEDILQRTKYLALNYLYNRIFNAEIVYYPLDSTKRKHILTQKLSDEDINQIVHVLSNFGFTDMRDLFDDANLSYEPSLYTEEIEYLINTSLYIDTHKDSAGDVYYFDIPYDKATEISNCIKLMNEIRYMLLTNTRKKKKRERDPEIEYLREVSSRGLDSIFNDNNLVATFDITNFSQLMEFVKRVKKRLEDGTVLNSSKSGSIDSLTRQSRTNERNSNEPRQGEGSSYYTSEIETNESYPELINFNSGFIGIYGDIPEEFDLLNENLPAKIDKNIMLVSLGSVSFRIESIFSERYIYFPGFVSERSYPSIDNPKEKDYYKSMILYRDRKLVFRVESKTDPTKFFEGDKPSTPWMSVVKSVEARKRELSMESGNKNKAVSGPMYYGFTTPFLQDVKRIVLEWKKRYEAEKVRLGR